MKRLHYIFLTLTIVWMTVIFVFSAQTGDTSSGTSGVIVNFIISIFVPDYKKYDIIKQQDIFHTISFIIRKGAHFTEYAILGALSFMSAVSYIWKKVVSSSADSRLEILASKRWRYGIGSLVFSCLYAISDEFHQGFVADRAPAVRDVCIDTCGALVGIVIVYFALLILLKKIKSPKSP